MVLPAQSTTEAVEAALDELLTGVLDTVPRLVAAAIFLALAYVGVRLVLFVVRRAVDRLLPPDQELVVDLVVLVAGLFCWFAVALALLKIVGMGDVAASLGTAAGFVALGVSYALSNMIADTVAGVYLLRDRHFNVGDRVVAESVTGEVLDIGLRKSRLETDDGNVVVIANRDVDKRWTMHPDDSPTADEPASSD